MGRIKALFGRIKKIIVAVIAISIVAGLLYGGYQAYTRVVRKILDRGGEKARLQTTSTSTTTTTYRKQTTTTWPKPQDMPPGEQEERLNITFTDERTRLFLDGNVYTEDFNMIGGFRGGFFASYLPEDTVSDGMHYFSFIENRRTYFFPFNLTIRADNVSGQDFMVPYDFTEKWFVAVLDSQKRLLDGTLSVDDTAKNSGRWGYHVLEEDGLSGRELLFRTRVDGKVVRKDFPFSDKVLERHWSNILFFQSRIENATIYAAPDGVRIPGEMLRI